MYIYVECNTTWSFDRLNGLWVLLENELYPLIRRGTYKEYTCYVVVCEYVQSQETSHTQNALNCVFNLTKMTPNKLLLFNN